MEGNCPKCRVRLEFPTSGVYQCERCKCRFEVALGAPNPPAPPPPVPGGVWAGWGTPGAVPPTPGQPAAASISSPPGWGAPVPAPGAGATCASHPDNPAATVCERCGDFMCRLCTTQVEGRAYCPKCFDLLYSRGALGFAQRQFTAPGITLALGLAALFLLCLCFPVSIPVGIGGIITGTKALKEHRERPELPSRGLTVWGVSLSVLSIVLSIVASGAIGYAIWKTP